MGCWNATCGISQIAITHGTKVKVVIIQNKEELPEASGFCYLSGYATPISFIIDGEYNDYGGIDNIDEEAYSSKLFLEYFRRGLASGKIRVQGDNYYDTSDFGTNPIDYSKLGIKEVINNLIERGRVSVVVDYYNYKKEKQEKKIVNIGIQIFQTSIVNSIIDSIYKDNSWENKERKRDILKKDMIYAAEDLFTNKLNSRDQEYIDKLTSKLKDVNSEEERRIIQEEIDDYILVLNKFSRKQWSCEEIRKEGKWSNQISLLSSREIVNSEVFMDYFRIIKKEKEKDVKELANMFGDLIELIYSMISVREKWSAQSEKGSQAFDHSAYLGLAKGIKDAVYANRGIKEGSILYCYEKYEKNEFLYEIGNDYIVESVDWEKDEIKIKGFGTLNWNEYVEHFE